jgi:hypothetical protein
MNNMVTQAKKELYELLEKNPELITYQARLSEAMDEVPESERLSVIASFLKINLTDLRFELLRLKNLLEGGKNEIRLQ